MNEEDDLIPLEFTLRKPKPESREPANSQLKESEPELKPQAAADSFDEALSLIVDDPEGAARRISALERERDELRKHNEFLLKRSEIQCSEKGQLEEALEEIAHDRSPPWDPQDNKRIASEALKRIGGGK